MICASSSKVSSCMTKSHDARVTFFVIGGGSIFDRYEERVPERAEAILKGAAADC